MSVQGWQNADRAVGRNSPESVKAPVVVLCGCHTDSPDQHQQGKCRTNDAPSVHQLLSSQSDCGIPEEKREIKRFEATGTLRGIHFG